MSRGDVERAIDRGVNYLNWCGHPDAMSRAIAGLGPHRSNVILAVQFQARTGAGAAREFQLYLDELRVCRIDVVTLYYVEAQDEWDAITAPGGAWEYLDGQKRAGRVGLIGLTTHQRDLAARWAGRGLLDLLMIRYNAAHRGAETDVFPIARQARIPVVAFTGLRWRALLNSTPDDPPDFVPPSAACCYRFCLANEDVAVAVSAPMKSAELDENLLLLDDWRPPSPEELAAIRAHGDRVRRHAGTFW